MERQRPRSTDEAVERITTFIVKQMQEGADKETAVLRLMASGVREEIARELVEQVYGQVEQVAEAETYSGSLLPPILGGVLAAGVGGLLWGLVTIFTGYEIGWVAWGIGVLAGGGVVMFAGGGKGLPLQFVAVGAAFLGVLIGKYFTFYSVLKDFIAEEGGAESVAQVSMLDPGVMILFGLNFGSMLSGFDALWVLLAVGTAWGIPKAKGQELEEGT